MRPLRRRCDPVALIRAHPILRRHGCSDPGDPDVAEALARREWAEGSERSSRVRSQNGSLKRGQHDMPGGFLGMATSPLPDRALTGSRVTVSFCRRPVRIFDSVPTDAMEHLCTTLGPIAVNQRRYASRDLTRQDGRGYFLRAEGCSTWQAGQDSPRLDDDHSCRHALGVPAARGPMSFRARRSTATQRGATHSSGHGVMPTLQDPYRAVWPLIRRRQYVAQVPIHFSW